MRTNCKPATPLPWKSVQADQGSFSTFWILDEEREDADVDDQNADYIAHAANAYPKLVEALRNALEQIDHQAASAAGWPDSENARILLRELGEELWTAL